MTRCVGVSAVSPTAVDIRTQQQSASRLQLRDIVCPPWHPRTDRSDLIQLLPLRPQDDLEGLVGAPDALAVCDLVKRAAAAVAVTPPGSAEDADEGADAGDPAVGTVLAGGLRVLQTAALVAGEETASGAAAALPNRYPALAFLLTSPCLFSPPPTPAAMISSGVMESAVRLLERMGPPAGPRGSRPPPTGPGPWVEEEFNAGAAQAGAVSGSDGGGGDGGSVPAPPGNEKEKEEGAKELYFGFRRDLVALVGNLCHARPAAVAALMAASGVPVVLQQCRGDEGALSPGLGEGDPSRGQSHGTSMCSILYSCPQIMC